MSLYCKVLAGLLKPVRLNGVCYMCFDCSSFFITEACRDSPVSQMCLTATVFVSGVTHRTVACDSSA